MLTYSEFFDHCIRNEQEQQDRDYIESAIRRLYHAYQHLIPHISPGDTILSAGIGSAYLETAIADTVDVTIYGADFEKSIQSNRALLSAYDIEPIPTDLTADDPLPGHIAPDVVISSEVVEHLPEPASDHISKLKTSLDSDGILYLSTPNLVRLRVIVKMLLGETYLPSAEQLFSKSAYEHEGTHRREYIKREIEIAFDKTGFDVVESGYTFNHDSGARDWRLWLLYPAEKAIPRFRPIMYFVAKPA